MSEETSYDEIAQPPTEEQWQLLLRYVQAARPSAMPGLLAARQFTDSMNELQSMAGHSREQLEEVSQGLLAMATGEEERPEPAQAKPIGYITCPERIMLCEWCHKPRKTDAPFTYHLFGDEAGVPFTTISVMRSGRFVTPMKSFASGDMTNRMLSMR